MSDELRLGDEPAGSEAVGTEDVEHGIVRRRRRASAMIRATAGAIMKPWPLNPAAT